MRLEQDPLARTKNLIHGVQAFAIFIAGVLTIAVFVTDGSTDGRTGWYFALAWLSIPIIIYLAMVPMWSRTSRFSNPYASATLDVLAVILWLSAWAAVASYVAEGESQGTKTRGGSGCDDFGLGSAAKCRLSIATIIFGVIIMLLFVATSYYSIRAMMHYRRTGELPMQVATAIKSSDFAAQTQDAFSSNMGTDEFDDESNEIGHDPRQAGLGISRQHDDDEYALLHQAEAEEAAPVTQSPWPQRQVAPIQSLDYNQQFSSTSISTYEETSYGGAYGRRSSNPMQNEEGYDNPMQHEEGYANPMQHEEG